MSFANPLFLVWLQPGHSTEGREPENSPKSIHKRVHIFTWLWKQKLLYYGWMILIPANPAGSQSSGLRSAGSRDSFFSHPRRALAVTRFSGEFWTCSWVGLRCPSWDPRHEHSRDSSALVKLCSPFQLGLKIVHHIPGVTVHQSSLRNLCEKLSNTMEKKKMTSSTENIID